MREIDRTKLRDVAWDFIANNDESAKYIPDSKIDMGSEFLADFFEYAEAKRMEFDTREEQCDTQDTVDNTVDLSKCERGDILISTHGAKLEYIAPTPWRHYTYLDHVVRYIEDGRGDRFSKDNYGTRTNDGFVFAFNRKPETDHDIVKVIKSNDNVMK